MRQMTAETVCSILDCLERAAVDVWLDGGWGVDALLGAQTRPHGDLDVIVSQRDVPRLCEALGRLGYAIKPGGAPANFVLADATGNAVDVHAVEFDERGYGLFRLPDGRTWPFPPQAFAGQGTVAGRIAKCLSPDAQVQCHAQGYTPTEKDLHDMQQLQARFGMVLPLGMCRGWGLGTGG
jgi:lincosamide nucleotidyltransferase A/C/D/E